MVAYAWAITSYSSIFVILLITGICFACFVRPYLADKRTAWYVGIAYCAMMLVLYLIPFRLNNFMAYAAGVLAAFLVMYAMDRRNMEQKIFLAVTFFSLRWLSIAMADKIDSALSAVIVMQKTLAARPWVQYGIYLATKVLNIVISFLLIAAAMHLLNRAVTYKKGNMTKTELIMLLMPSFSAITGYGILQFYQNIYEKDTGKSLTNVYGIYGAFSFLHYLVSVVSILVMAVMFQRVKAVQEEAAGQKLVQSQAADMKKHIGEVEKLYRDIRLLRHDMGNHIQTIEHLIECNEKEEAVRYTARLRKEWQETGNGIQSGNPVTDVILMEKKKQAEEQNIRFHCDFHYPEGKGIDAFDISVILNNALDNSLEAAGGNSPYIRITSYCKNNIFMIVISNSFEGWLVTDEINGLPVSGKTDAGHGLGLLNIRRVAQIYLGDIALEQEEGKVVLTVMLQFQ
ncbi:MAG: GHKL domain-containing protein [Clostridiaceae bacterium]|nr:GHKL domain-containing protein [Clostridiaceae bacterium]